MNYKINKLAAKLEDKLISYRRDFHKYPEPGWTEFRTASKVAARLNKLGYETKVGREVVAQAQRMGVPAEELLEKEYQRAKKQGADPEYLEKIKGGYTGVVGILKNGKGPTTAFRFDMDAVEVEENSSKQHRPFKEGFASQNLGAMHACGHDGHTAIGLTLAELLMEIKDNFSGTIKLIFQPGEEGLRGARSMAAAGVVDDVDYLFGLHLGMAADSCGEIFAGAEGFLASSKFDVYFKGAPSHAGAAPEKGKNALLAAANAVTNLYAIPRHSQGITRINVGKLNAGSGRNVIADKAHLVIETRGENSELNNYMYESAKRILKNSAEMYDLDMDIKAMGGAESGKSDEELVNKIMKVAEKSAEFSTINKIAQLGGSEDFTVLMQKVQNNGGQVSYMILGTELAAAHHTAEFDIDENSLIKGVKLLANLVLDINN